MKKLAITLGFFATTTVMQAQDCAGYLYMTNNAEIQMTVYDKKGQPSGVQTWKVSDVKKDGNSITSTIQTSFKDDKGKEITKGSGTYKCKGGILEADVRMSMPQEQMQQGTEVSMASAYLEYPSAMSVGQSLKDADFAMDMKMGTGVNAKVNFREDNRKVLSKENITTPAGSWDAYVIAYDGNMKTQMGPIGIPVNFSAKEWFVPGFGIVKSETYSKNGKLVGSTMLTSIKK